MTTETSAIIEAEQVTEEIKTVEELSTQDATAPEAATETVATTSPLTPERTYTQKEYAGIQRSLQRAQERLQRLESQGQDLGTIHSDIGELREGLAIALESMTNQGLDFEEEEVPRESSTQKKVREWKERQQQRQQQQQAPNPYAGFITAASAAGFTPDSPEIAEFFSQPRTPDEALRELPNLILRRNKETTVDAASKNTKSIADDENAVLRQEVAVLKARMEGLGLTTVETGGPSASGSRNKTPYEARIGLVKRLKGET